MDKILKTRGILHIPHSKGIEQWSVSVTLDKANIEAINNLNFKLTNIIGEDIKGTGFMEWCRLYSESTSAKFGRYGSTGYFQKNLKFEVIDSVGVIVETYYLLNSTISDVHFGVVEYWASNDLCNINVSINISEIEKGPK